MKRKSYNNGGSIFIVLFLSSLISGFAIILTSIIFGTTKYDLIMYLILFIIIFVILFRYKALN